MAVRVSYKKQFVFGIMLFLVLLLALEGFARSYEIINPKCAFLGKDAFDKTDNMLTRIICIDHKRSFGALDFDVIPILSPNQHLSTININSHGFRGPETTLEKPDNTFRIFVVGGSTTLGVAATSDETTIPGYLQQKFDATNLGFKVEVINAGIGSADSASEMYFIKKKFLAFNPDMFIIYDGWNDAINDVKYEEYEEKEYITSWRWPISSYYRTPFLYDILFKTPDQKGYNLVNDPELIPVKVELWKKRWQEICDINRSKEIKTLIIVQPILGTGKKSLSPDESLLAPIVREQNHPLVVLDGLAKTLPELEQHCDKTVDLRNIYDDVAEPVYMDFGHTTDFGSEIVAQKIYEITLPMIEKM